MTARSSNRVSPRPLARSVASSFSLLLPARTGDPCPSCGAKRAAIFSSRLQERILAEVPHPQWVFSMPKVNELPPIVPDDDGDNPQDVKDDQAA